MKKIFFGLFLTLGFSSILHANDDVKNNKSQIKQISDVGSCEYTTITSYKDGCGRLQGVVKSWPQWMECPQGVQAGTKISNHITVVVGNTQPCEPTEPSTDIN